MSSTYVVAWNPMRRDTGPFESIDAAVAHVRSRLEAGWSPNRIEVRQGWSGRMLGSWEPQFEEGTGVLRHVNLDRPWRWRDG